MIPSGIKGRKPHISVSQLNTFTNCGERWKQRYVMGRKIPPGVAAVVGSGVDTSVNRNLVHKVENDGALLTQEEVQDRARDGALASWRKGVMLSSTDVFLGVKKVRGAAIDKAVRLATLHLEEFAPEIEPLSADHVQRRWRVPVKGLPVDIVGVIDVQEEATLRDTKTTAKSPSRTVAETSLQGTAYVMAAWVIDKLDLEQAEFTLDYLIDTKRPRARQYRAKRTKEHIRILLRRVSRAVEGMEAGRFLPADPEWWGCSRRYCGYWQTCPYAHGRKLVSLSS